MEHVTEEKPQVCPLCKTPSPAFHMRKNNCSLYKCGSCKFWFVYPLPKLDDVYNQDYFTGGHGGFGYVNYDRDKQPMVSTSESYVKLIEKYSLGHGRWLDVGAATGFFLSIVQRFGFEPSGVEMSAYAAGVARDKGFSVITGTSAQVPDEPKYDVVSMIDVIEHVSDPRAEILRVRELLKDGGLFFLDTQDTGSLYARIMGRRWHLIVPPEHVNYFSRKNLSLLLTQCGFDVLELTTIGKRFSLPYIFSMLYKWQKLSLWLSLAQICERGWLAKIYLPINLRDTMSLVARKRS